MAATDPKPTLGPVTFGEVPRVAAILERFPRAGEVLALGDSGASVLEFRIDAFSTPFEEILAGLKLLRSERAIVNRFGFLGTIREDSFQGTNRMSWFEEMLPFVDAIDIEYESNDRDALIKLAHDYNRLALVSTHDFEQTPDTPSMEMILKEAMERGADLVKLAVYAKCEDDLWRLLEFTRKHRKSNLITIAMGEIGLLSRVAAPIFGSLLSYGYVDQPNAPGQLSLRELHDELMRYHPAYAAEFGTRH